MRAIFLSVILFLSGQLSGQLVRDSSFGSNGIQFIASPYKAISMALTFKTLKNGGFLCLLTSSSGGIYTLYLHKAKSSGQPDSSFGINGFLPLGASGQRIGNIGVEADDLGNYYSWGTVTNYLPNLGPGKIWLSRFDSAGRLDTTYKPLAYLKNGRLSSYYQDFFSLGVNDKGYLAMTASYGPPVLVRLNRDGRLDSTWSQDGIADSVLFRIQGLTENGKGEVNLYGILDVSAQCARMTLSPTGAKDLKRSMKGWITIACGTYLSPEPGVMGIGNLQYNKARGTNELAITLLRTMSETVPDFGKIGKAIVPADSAKNHEAVDILKNKDGNYLVFWRRYDYAPRLDDQKVPGDYWSGMTFIDSQGFVISDFGDNGRSFLLDQGRDYYALKKAELQPDGSIVGFMSMWNKSPYTALLVKFKSPVVQDKKEDTSINHNSSNNVLINNRVQVFPNPAENFVQVSASGLLSYYLTDMAGRVVRSGSLGENAENHLIQLDLISGVYVCHLKHRSGVIYPVKVTVR